MQTVSDLFNDLATSDAPPYTYKLRASFDKSFDSDVDFFTLSDGVTPMSLLDGPDVLAPSDNNIIQEWDKYDYTDYTDRVITLEVTREELEPYSIVQAFADVTLNNYDDYFTPNSGSPIDQYILPKRPFRILMGFGAEAVPVFVGLSEKIPTINKQQRTATFHLIDFMTFLLDKKIDETIMLLDVSTGEILDYLFQFMGLIPSQYVLDETSFNRVPFFYVEKGTRFGDIVQDIMVAEQGRLYMDELGIIRFLNRQNYPTTPVYSFDKSNVSDYDVSTEDDVINYVKIEADVLEEMSEQSIGEQAEITYIPAGQTKDVWINTQDPITNATTPAYSPTQVESSHFISTLDSGGTIPYTSISVDSISVFSKSVKITFENTGSENAYVVAMDIWGTPVKKIDEIIVEEFDQASIDALEERRYELKTPYIQKVSSAISKAGIIIDDYKDYGSIVTIDNKGNSALQTGDMVTLDIDGYQGNYVITKMENFMVEGYRQRLTGKLKQPRMYFILSSDSEARSLLDGSDVLTP